MKKTVSLIVIFLLVSPLFSLLLPKVRAVPILSNGYVTPTTGNTSTQFYYYVTYYDPAGIPPDTTHVVIDGSNVWIMTLYNGVPSNGIYRYSTTLSVGTHTYYFRFTSGGYTIYLPTPPGYSGPTVNPLQRKLTVYSAHDSPNPPNGDWFFNDGQSVTCSVTSPVTEGGTVWTCTGWSGTGSVPSSGSGTSVTFTITQDSSITWNWQGTVQRKLTVYSAHDSPVPGNGDHYYDDGDQVTCSVTSPVTEGDTVWTCIGWSGAGSVPSSGTSSTVTFTITQDSAIIWNWQGLVNNPPSSPQFSSWSSTLFKGGLGTYEAYATDPDNDDVTITFDWGDGTQDTVGPASSGTLLSHSHSWSHTGMYEVRARATDSHGLQSDWSTSVEVTILTSLLEDIWAGYVIQSTSQSVTSVEGRWYVPAFGVEKYGIHGIWVGVGGVGHTNLLQAGVMAMTDPDKGETHYSLFLEMVPGWGDIFDDPSKSGCHIFPGDAIRVKISERSSSPGVWDIEIENISQGWTWVHFVTYSPDKKNAEWIFEPGAGGTNMPSSFEAITFGGATLEIDSTVYEMGQVGHNLDVNLIKYVCVRDSETITYISPINSYKVFDISDTGNRPPPPPPVPITSLSLHSSAELHVYDSQMNHLGYNSTTGLLDAQIPNSFYFEDEGVQYVHLFTTDSYQVILSGTENGIFHLHTQIISDETTTLDRWVNGTIGINEKKTYSLIHQISLQDLSSSKTVVKQGDDCSINAVVVNDGNYTEIFDVTAYANTIIIGTQLVTLSGGNSATITFTWSTTGFALGSYTISAYATLVLGEMDTTDNTYIDGIVNVISSEPPPSVPEFPLSLTLEITLIPLILYLWMKRKHVRIARGR